MHNTRMDIFFYLRKISAGIIISLFIVAAVVLYNTHISLGEIFLSETMPDYHLEKRTVNLYGLLIGNEAEEPTEEPYAAETYAPASGDDAASDYVTVIGRNNVSYVQDDELPDASADAELGLSGTLNIENLRDIDYLKNNFYLTDKNTAVTQQDFSADDFLNADFKTEINKDKPQVLIFHTHSNEMFADSDESDIYEGVVGLGRELAEILADKYGISSMHDKGRYDMVNQVPDRDGSYQRMEVNIQKILNENPSIELAIDLHRDGVSNESIKFVTEVNGKPTAQIMFVNGLSKVFQNGRLTEVMSLPNPNLGANLALSFQMQLMSKSMYPTFSRKLYIKAYRYSLHMLPMSLLVEVGAQTNTKQEALNAMEPLADLLYEVVFKK